MLGEQTPFGALGEKYINTKISGQLSQINLLTAFVIDFIVK